jgi:hypothetical protein
MQDQTDLPVEGARRRRSLRYAAVGAVIGMLLVLLAFIVATLTGDTHWSFAVILALFGGAAVGATFAPLLSLARDDGDDDDAIRDGTPLEGRADTHVDGAQARDRADAGRQAPPG